MENIHPVVAFINKKSEMLMKKYPMLRRLENWLTADPRREAWLAAIIAAVVIPATFVVGNMIVSS